MDRSQEKLQSLPPKVLALDSTANIQKPHEKLGIRGSQRTFSPESSIENKPHGRSNGEGFLGRKPELGSHLQAQYYHPGLMGLPYLGMTLPSSGIDPRNSANLYYTYNSPVMGGYHGIPGGYGQAKRPPNGEEMGRDGRVPYNAQADRSERPDPGKDRESREPIRTESVIKIASDRSDPRSDARKPDPSDKRAPEEIPTRFMDRNGDVDRQVTSFRGQRDVGESRNPSNGDTTKGTAKSYNGNPTEYGAYGSHRISQGPTSFTSTSSSRASDFTYSEQKTGSKNPHLASEYSRSVSEHSRTLPENSRMTSDTTRTISDPTRAVSSSSIFSSMPKLTPITARDPLGPYSDGDHRQSPIAPPWRPPYLTYAGPRSDIATSYSVTSSQRGPAEKPIAEENRDLHAQRTSYGARAFDKEDAIAARESYEKYARASYYPYTWGSRMGEMHSGHYQTHGYPRPPPASTKRTEKDEKDSEDVRQRSGEDSRGTTPPERFPNKQAKKSTMSHDHHGKKDSEKPDQREQYNKNEKPVLPENSRCKVSEEKKGALKSDPVKMYTKQGQAIIVSVRESSPKVSDFFSNGRTITGEIPRKDGALPSSEPTSKRDAAYRMSALIDSSKKPEVVDDKPVRDPENDASRSEYHRRWTEILNNDKSMSQAEEAKKNNDKNNNAPYEMYSYSSYHSDRARNPNRITLSQDKVFVPPNATLEMFEKREQEMERVRAACSRDAARSVHDARGIPQDSRGITQDSRGITQDSRGIPQDSRGIPQDSRGIPQDSRGKHEEESKHRHNVADDAKTNKATPYGSSNSATDRRTETQESSDDDDVKVIEDKTTSSSGSESIGSHQSRHSRADDRRGPSPSYAASRQRITSPPSERSSTHSSPYAPYAGSYPARRPDNEFARGEMERNFHGNMGFQTASGLYSANMQYPQFAHMLGGIQMDPYNMYRGAHMMDPSAQGLAQDPVTGSIMMVPEAYLALFNPMVAAESQFMMDPSMARFYGMQQTHMDDPRLQQFYQMMQSQQQKHLHEHAQQQLQEKYKQEMMMAAQQGAWANTSFYQFYQKQMEAHRKEERERREASEQRPKSQEEQPNRPTSEKPESKGKEDVAVSVDRKQARPQSSEAESKSEQTRRAQESAAKDNTANAVESRDEGGRDRTRPGDAVNDKIKEYQFQQYLLQGGFSNNTRFPFPPVPTSSAADSSKPPVDATRDVPRNPRDAGENYRAAVALAHMDKDVRGASGQRSEEVESSSAHSTAEQRIGQQVATAPDSKLIGRELGPSGTQWSSERSAFSQRDTTMPAFSAIKTISAGVPPAAHANNLCASRSIPSGQGGPAVTSTISTISEKTQYQDTCGGSGSARAGTSHVEEGHIPLLVAEVEKLSQDNELEVIRVGSDRVGVRERLPSNDTKSRLPNSQSEISQEMGLLIAHSKQQHTDPLESPSNKSEIFWMEDSEAEDDFEIRTINSSFRPLRREFDSNDKENSLKISLTNTKSEEEKRKIRENIERLRAIAKSRAREERFTVFTRNRELRSPTSIVNNVTASINEMLEMNVLEKDIRMRLAELQKKYREKHRELARLQPRARDGHEEGVGKSTPVKRGPGRPRKRKYFGASTRSGKTTPAPNTNGSTEVTSRSERSTPLSLPQSPSMRSVTSEENLVTRDNEEPPRKKKRRQKKLDKESEKIDKESETGEKESEGDSGLLPSPPLIMSRIEIEEMEGKTKNKKSAKDEFNKPVKVKAKRSATASPAKDRTISPLPVNENIFITPMARLISAISPSGFDDTSNDSVPIVPLLTTQERKPKKVKKVKKSKKEKVSDDVENSEQNDKSPKSSKAPSSESPKSGKPKKIKSPKKSKKSCSDVTTPVSKFEFPDLLSAKTNSYDEKVDFNFANQPQAAYMESKGVIDGCHDDEVFASYHGVDALDMLADFASTAEKRKGDDSSAVGANTHAPERVRRKVKPKKPFTGSLELDDVPAPKKKKKKKKSTGEGKEEKPPKKKTPPPRESTPPRATEPEAMVEPLEEPLVVKEEQEPILASIEEFPKEKEESIEVVEEPEQAQEIDTPEASPPLEPVKEKRRKSRAGSIKDELSPFSLFGDWQPRRSERIFINSSVPNTCNLDTSPLSSPTAKTGEFGWPKKSKKISKGKKSSKSSSHSDPEMVEEEVESPTALKPSVKPKKKSPTKSKKRRSSSVNDPDFVVRKPRRKAAKREKNYEEADEDEEDEDARYDDDADQEDNEMDVEETIDEELESTGHLEPDDLENANAGEGGEAIVIDSTMGEEGQLKIEDDQSKIEEEVPKKEKKKKKKAKKEEYKKERNKKEDRKEEKREEKQLMEEVPEDARSKEHLENDETTESLLEVAKEKPEEKQSAITEDVSCDQIPTVQEENVSVTENSKGEEQSEPEAQQGEGGADEELKSQSEGDEGTKDKAESSTEEETQESEEKKSDECAEFKQEELRESKPEVVDPPFTFTKGELLENTQMLVPVDRVFFRGHITFYQEPDLYGIVLNGERGRRPHLRSTDQLLTQAVKDIEPPSVLSIPIGTRVCAHWSPQYRCYYPGNVIEAPPDEKEQYGKVWIEFDDGDSGIFPLNEIRRITTQFAMEVEDVESDVLLPDMRSRSSSLTNVNVASPSKKKEDTPRNKDETSFKSKEEDLSDAESADNIPVRRSRSRVKRRGRLSTRERRLSEATDSDCPRENPESDVEESSAPKKERSRSTRGQPDRDSKEELKAKRERKSRNNEDSDVKIKEEKADHSRGVESASTKLSKQDEDESETVTEESDPPVVASRPRGRPSRSSSDLDLRKRSLTLNLNSTNTRSSCVGADSPRHDSHDEDSGSCSDAFDESPQTESKVFQPRLGKRRRSELDRLRQDLKSSGQLWQWSGKGTHNKRKGKGRKVFYKNITRGEETISVGDCAVFTSNPSKTHNLPYVGKIESMWEAWNGAMVVRVRWFYHPEETKPGRRTGDLKNSLYRSTHVDENEIQTISHKCDVLSPEAYKSRMHTQETMATRSSTNERHERLFCCTGSYDPSTEKIES